MKELHAPATLAGGFVFFAGALEQAAPPEIDAAAPPRIGLRRQASPARLNRLSDIALIRN